MDKLSIDSSFKKFCCEGEEGEESSCGISSGKGTDGTGERMAGAVCSHILASEVGVTFYS